MPLLAWALTGDDSRIAQVECLAQKATVHGYARYSLHHRDFPGVIRKEDNSVDGYLLTLNTDQRKKLDNFEGEAEYEAVAVTVTVFEDDDSIKTVDADMYLWIGDAELLTGDPWDLQTFINERLEDWIDLFSFTELVGDD